MNTRHTELRSAIAKHTPTKQQEIREAYYKAAEGLTSLVDELEGTSEPIVVAERDKALAALAIFNRLTLGAIL